MLSLQGDLEAAGGAIALDAPLVAATADPDGFGLAVGGPDPLALRCRMLVNSAGLWAPAVARAIGGLPAGLVPAAYHAKGNYFTLRAARRSRLIYPVPEPGGLGVHLTVDLAGQTRFGPDVEWVETMDYAVDPGARYQFYAAIRRYWPASRTARCSRARRGPAQDRPAGGRRAGFRGTGAGVHGLPGLVNLFGISRRGSPRRWRSPITSAGWLSRERRPQQPHNQRMSASAPIRLRGVFDTLLD